MADAIARAVRADAGSVLAFLPGAARNPPHRDAAEGARRRATSTWSRSMARSTRDDAGPRDRARRAGPPQDRAGDVDRRNFDHDRRRAHRRRLRARARAALRAGRRSDAARDRAGLARGRRSAARPRRTHRAGHLLPAVGRAADRVARAVMRGRKFWRPICRRFVLDLAAWGVDDPSKLAFLDPPPRAGARRGEGACWRSLARSTPRPHHRGRPALRRLPLPPRLARMVVDAARDGAGALAAEMPRC